MRLHTEGWIGDSECSGAWEPEGDLLYRSGLAQPLSYFARLALRDSEVAKGVVEIKHRMTDNYYKCLLLLDSGNLLKMIDGMEGKKDEWFRTQLSKSGASAAQAALDAEEEHRPPLAVLDRPGDDEYALPLVPSVVQSSEWSRCIVSQPGVAPAKVYFDHSSHSSGRQRGWVDCTAHGCIKYEFCAGGKAAFCCAMHLWRLGCEREGCWTKREHLKWSPAQDDIAAALPSLSFSDF